MDVKPNLHDKLDKKIKDKSMVGFELAVFGLGGGRAADCAMEA